MSSKLNVISTFAILFLTKFVHGAGKIGGGGVRGLSVVTTGVQNGAIIMQELDFQKQKWSQERPRNVPYTFTYSSNMCDNGAPSPGAVDVNGMPIITSAPQCAYPYIFEENNGVPVYAYDANNQFVSVSKTMEDIFQMIFDAVQTPEVETIEVVYDESYGSPSFIKFLGQQPNEVFEATVTMNGPETY